MFIYPLCFILYIMIINKINNNKNKNNYINIIPNLLSQIRLSQFQYLFPFKTEIEIKLKENGIYYIKNHNNKIKSSIINFPKLTDAYWQVFRRNLYHSSVQYTPKGYETKEIIDSIIAKSYLKLNDDFGCSNSKEILSELCEGENAKNELRKYAKEKNLIENVGYFIENGFVCRPNNKNTKYVTSKEKPFYDLINISNFYGVKLYNFVDKNKTRHGNLVESLFDLNSKRIPFLEEY